MQVCEHFALASVIIARSPNPINGEGELKAVKDSSFITIGSSYRGGQGDRWGAISHFFFGTRDCTAHKRHVGVRDCKRQSFLMHVHVCVCFYTNAIY